MSSYEDEYCYPDTDGVLKNNLNIREHDLLAQAEASVVGRAMRNGLREPFEFTSEGLRNVHRQMFEKLYPFAGEFRRVDMAKVADDGNTRVDFALGAFVERVELKRFFERDLAPDLNSERGFKAPTLPEFAHRASVYLKDLNFIHPFPEGNGRVQRVFLQQLAGHSGHMLDFTKITPQAWISASIESYCTPEQKADGSFSRHPKMSALIAQACGQDRKLITEVIKTPDDGKSRDDDRKSARSYLDQRLEAVDMSGAQNGDRTQGPDQDRDER